MMEGDMMDEEHQMMDEMDYEEGDEEGDMGEDEYVEGSEDDEFNFENDPRFAEYPPLDPRRKVRREMI
jgi:hypothetical protein